MKQLGGKIDGSYVVAEDVNFSGMITGGATVTSGVLFELGGMVCGDLTVERGGQAIIRGTVNGTVRNLGGEVTVHGSVGAVRDLSSDCPTNIKAGAMIAGQI
jgi:hypothetical protein